MAIRQEIYDIYVRPSIEVNGVSMYFDKNLETFMIDPFKKSGATCKHIATEKTGTDDGVWLHIFETTSLEQAQVKVKKIIKNIGVEFIKIEKKVPMSSIITPLS